MCSCANFIPDLNFFLCIFIPQLVDIRYNNRLHSVSFQLGRHPARPVVHKEGLVGDVKAVGHLGHSNPETV